MPDYNKQLIEAGITTSSDGVLKEFINRKNYQGALATGVIPFAIAKREEEIDFLHTLERNLIEEVGETNEDC